MSPFIQGMAEVLVVRRESDSASLSRDWRAVGQDLWTAVRNTAEEDDIVIVHDQLELPLGTK